MQAATRVATNIAKTLKSSSVKGTSVLRTFVTAVRNETAALYAGICMMQRLLRRNTKQLEAKAVRDLQLLRMSFAE